MVQRGHGDGKGYAARGVGGSVYFTDRPCRTRVELDDGVGALLRRLKKAFDLNDELEPLPEPETFEAGPKQRVP